MSRKNPKDTFLKMKKADYLRGAKGRLENDVGPYFDKLSELAAEKKYVGFWGTARLIFPVIEATADVIYRKTGAKEDRPQRLLRKLDVPYPHLVWQMYRNSLMHSDYLVSIRHNGKKIGWSIGYGMNAHIIKEGSIHIDTRKLYDDLLAFLESEANLAGNKSVYAKTGIHFRRNTVEPYKSELKDLAR